MISPSSVAWLLVWAVVGVWPAGVAAQALDTTLETQTETVQAAIRSQDKIDKLADETQQALAAYQSALRQTKSLGVYNEQLDRLLASQQREIESLGTQLQEIEVTQREIVPLLVRMFERLDQFVALDVPFLPEERQTRLTRLQGTLDDADATVAEKYRAVMEAYQIEANYGRTIEAYRGTIAVNDEEQTVDLLRIGRLALVYRSLDGEEVGQWNHEARLWEPISGQYLRAIDRGLEVAEKRAIPQLLELPISAPNAAAPVREPAEAEEAEKVEEEVLP